MLVYDAHPSDGAQVLEHHHPRLDVQRQPWQHPHQRHRPLTERCLTHADPQSVPDGRQRYGLKYGTAFGDTHLGRVGAPRP